MKKAMDPRFLLIASMAIFGTLGPFVRNIPVSSGELALYRAVMATLLVGAFLLISGQKIPFAKLKKEIPLLLLSGMAMGIIFPRGATASLIWRVSSPMSQGFGTK